jgi:SAM-dependent methyltransferase
VDTATNRSETDFGSVAPFYSGRAPYVPEFFRVVVDTLPLPKAAFVVDLACGAGELASGISPYCRAVLAFDKSVAMLAARPKDLANVTFVQTDLNSEPLQVLEQADLVLIGRAIHHLDKNRLLPALASLAKPGGTVLICGAGMTRNNPCYASYHALLKRYGRAGIKTKEMVGFEAFAETNWKPSREDIVVFSRVRWGVAEFVRHARSYSSASAAISAAGEAFERELQAVLSPYWDQAGSLDLELVNWGVPYQRTG